MGIINRKKTLKLFLQIFWKVFMGISVVCTVFGWFMFDDLKEHRLLYIIVILLLTLFISLILLINDLIQRGIADNTDISIPDQLLEIVSKLKIEASDVLFDAIDRYFHLYGYDDKRIKLAHLIIDKSKDLDKNKENNFDSIIIENAIKNLIDNVGWASYRLNKIESAISTITVGVDLAKKNSLYFFAAKGERHLASIELHRDNMTTFSEHLNKSEEYTQLIQEKKDKTEMKGSLYLLEAKYLLKQGKLSESEGKANKAKKFFSKDPRRQVKVYAVLGHIHYEREEWDQAHLLYLKGYTLSKDIRKDERAKNAFGLAKLYLNHKATKYYNRNKAHEYLKEADDLGYPLGDLKNNMKINSIEQIVDKKYKSLIFSDL